MYAIYGDIYHQYTPNVSTYTIHGSYGYIYIYTDRCIVSFMVPTPFKTTTQARIIIPNRNGTT